MIKKPSIPWKNGFNWVASFVAQVSQRSGVVRVLIGAAKGYVTLLGTAEWQYQREEAERVVRFLHGVTAVSNQIELKPKISANGVKVKIEEALKRDAQIEAKNVTVETAGNIVTLRGNVHSWRERVDAQHAAFGAPGVTGVVNLLTVSH